MPANLGETEPIRLTTADGLSLEAEARVPDGATGAALLCHPHPAHGGSMRSLVTSELFRTLPDRGVAVLRFNFRGVEGSQGEHTGGAAEHLDVAAGVAALAERVPGITLVTAGWSFGADLSLTVVDERLAGWFCIAPPLRVVADDRLVAAGDRRPKVLAVPEHDQFNPPDAARARSQGWVNTTIEVISGADHFLAGRTDLVADLLAGFLAGLAD